MSDEIVYYAEVPPGQVRTPINPPTKRGDLMAAGISTTIIAGIALFLRLYTRLQVLKKKLEADDWLVIAAYIISVAMLAFVQKDIDHGLTYHVWDIPQETYHIGERLYGLLAYLSFILSVSFAKMSMLVLYLRLAPHAWFRFTCYSCIAIIACYSLTAAFVESLACRPLQGIVDESLDAECYDSYPAYIALSSLSEDYDWDAVPDMILCFIEVNFGIICASVPAVRPFFSRFIPVLLSGRRKHSDSGSSGPSNNRVADTIEKKNKERQNLKRRNVGPEESYDMSTFGTDTSRYLDSSNDDEESRLWPPPAPNKPHGYSNVTEAP
ncbi:MHF histone-fold complex component [Hypoxylon texense]